MAGENRYAAFISYAHTDEAMAGRLHKALETYPIPKTLVDADRRALSPIFRDTAELTAHHSLTEKIRDAVDHSQYLIVLCSPSAKASHWVNEEIRLFRQIHGEGAILCVLSEGTPETSFPPALLEAGREPLAANLGTSRESFRLGVTQLAASILGVGLDQLIQRDSQRRRRRLQAITVGALAFSGVMGLTAFTAVEARKEADLNRTQAEGLVEYMITDLKDKLEPVGRLDILDGIGERAVDYYETQDIRRLSDESLARQARSRHVLGQVALGARDKDKARREIEAATKLTQEVLARSPNSSDAIFAHAQSQYWVGAMYYYDKDFTGAMPHWQAYADLGQRLYDIDPNNFDWVMERAHGSNNVALLHNRLKDSKQAENYYLDAIKYFEVSLSLVPNSGSVQGNLANALAGVAIIAVDNSEYQEAKEYRARQIELLEHLAAKGSDNRNIEYSLLKARMKMFEIDTQLMPEECLSPMSQNYLQQFKGLTEYDPENFLWNRAYHGYWYKFLTQCHLQLPDNLFTKYATEFLNSVQKTEFQETLSLERSEIISLLESNE